MIRMIDKYAERQVDRYVDKDKTSHMVRTNRKMEGCGHKTLTFI